jgi:cytidine deaminase
MRRIPERSALAAARAGGAVRISAVAVVCLDAQADLGLQGRTPCGACRQWLLELAPDAEVILGGVAQTFRVTDLLPHGFTLSLAPAAAGEVAAQPVLPQDGE